MAEKYELVRSKLQAKVFDTVRAFGIEVQNTRATSEVYNERGELEDSTPSINTIVIVPYNIFSDRLVYYRFGNSSDGELDFASPWDTDIELQDTFPFEDGVYAITQIEPSYLKERVVRIFRCTKQN